MPGSIDAISQDALVLPADQRLALALRLLESVEPEPDPEAAAAWTIAIEERIRRFDAGEARTIRSDRVFAELRQIAPE